jgi:Glycosyl transferase family 8.
MNDIALPEFSRSIKINNNLNIQGAFSRLEIPRIIKEHNILKMPDICPHYVLYADVDVLFPNKSVHEHIQILKDTFLSTLDSSAYVMYGREFSKDPHIMNTGVMMLHVEKFGHVLRNILQLADKKDYVTADQGMINNYFTQNQTTMRERILLPVHYNWKSYWKLEPSSFHDIKIYHHHGRPKPGKCLEIMADCNVDLIGTLSQQYKPYAEHIRQGICCDA